MKVFSFVLGYACQVFVCIILITTGIHATGSSASRSRALQLHCDITDYGEIDHGRIFT